MNYMHTLNKLITCLCTKGYHAYLQWMKNIPLRYSSKINKMEYTIHRKYFSMDHTFRKKGAYGSADKTPIPIYETCMSWLIKYHECMENVKKRACDEGNTLGSDDEIILGKNDLLVSEILYSTIYL